MSNVRDKSVFTMLVTSLIQIKQNFTEISDTIVAEKRVLLILRT
jgi:hypothetical protein